MGLFGAIKTFVVGKSDQAADAIEDKNRVMFAEQDMKEMESDLKKAQANFGKMKGQLIGLERDIKEKTSEKDGWIEKAKAVKAEGNEELALKCAQKSVDIQDELDALESQKQLIEGHVTQQENNVTKLNAAIDKGKRQLQSMKSIEQVAKSTENLLEINESGASSALAKFEEKNRKAQANLDEKTAMLEAQNAGNLDSEVDAVLGGDNKAKNLLDSL